MILGYRPYRGYFELNKNPITQHKEEFIKWDIHNDGTLYKTYEDAYLALPSLFRDSSSRTYKIETVYAPDAPIQDLPTYTPPIYEDVVQAPQMPQIPIIPMSVPSQDQGLNPLALALVVALVMLE